MNSYDTTTPYLAIERPSDLESVPQSKPESTQATARRPLYTHEQPEYATQKGHSGPSDFGKWTIVALVALLTALIVGGAIGGGLGASLASCNNDKITSNDLTAQLTVQVPTATATSVDAKATNGLLANYAVIPATNVYNISMDCAGLADNTQTTIFNPGANQNFKIYCGKDFGTAASQDADGNTVATINLVSTIQYTVANCLESCASFNRRAALNGLGDTLRCRSVTFTSRLHEALSAQEGNCWIKNGTPTDIDALPVSTDLGLFFILSAALQE